MQITPIILDAPIKQSLPTPLDNRSWYSTLNDALLDNFYTVDEVEIEDWEDEYDHDNPENNIIRTVSTNRFLGQKFMVEKGPNGKPCEYWFKDGLSDAHAVPYVVGGGGDVDLSDYYTKSQADNRFALKGSTGGGDVDLSNYYTKEQVNDKFALKDAFVTQEGAAALYLQKSAIESEVRRILQAMGITEAAGSIVISNPTWFQKAVHIPQAGG